MKRPEFKTDEEFREWADAFYCEIKKYADAGPGEATAVANKALEEYRESLRMVCPNGCNKVLEYNQWEKFHWFTCPNCIANTGRWTTKKQAAKAWAPKPKLKGPLSVERLSLLCGCTNGVKAIAHDSSGNEVEIKDSNKIWIEDGEE